MEKPSLRQDFETRSLDLDTFTHEDHIWLAWQYLGEKTVPETMVTISQGLRHLSAQANHPEAYHETLTCAWVCLIADRRDRATQPNCWKAFKTTNPDLFTNHRAIVGRYYTDDLLKTNHSRTHFLLPDRLAGV